MMALKVPYTSVKGTKTFTQCPDMKQVVLDNYKTMSLKQLEHLTHIKYKTIAEFLRLRGLQADRYAKKRINIQPLLNLSIEQLNYVAGILDGEGTFSLGKRTYKTGKIYLRPNITITNTSYFMLKYFQNLGFYGIEKTNNFGNRYWGIQQSGYSLIDFLVNVEPLLTAKRPVCRCLIEICKLRILQKKGDQPTPYMLKIASEVKRLNLRKDSFKKEKLIYNQYLTLLQNKEFTLPTIL